MSQNPTAQQYCLRWNNYQNNLTNVFDQLLQSEAFVDVTLACDGNSLKAHKMVLSACSPYFQSLFSENPCTHPIVILKDVKWIELKAIVEFVYRGEINVSQQELAPLLKVAEALKIRGLADVNRGTSAASQSFNHVNNGLDPDTGGLRRSDESAHAQTPLISPRPLPNQHLVHTPFLPHLPGKRRKYSFDTDRSATSSPPPPVSPPGDTLDDTSNPLEIDSPNGDYDTSVQSPLGVLEPMTITPGIVHGLKAPLSSSAPPGLSVPSTSTLSNVNEMDLKPGIVEMIREEERAKMLESSHGWLGSSGGVPPTLSDSYQYQIQSLWQKCWNTNQGGLHALRFRERGPLKSWRPETMAEAIFAVLREGLSLSQAARKFDIPYPTFVLYANRVHNMLGPSSDGTGANDLLSDMRPKGRGRPQRILLGTWPEDHIRGVIRAVVFRDGAKEELPYGLPFPRDLTPNNGVEMTLHQQLAIMNPYLSLQPSHLSHNSTSPSHVGSSQSTKSPTESDPDSNRVRIRSNMSDSHRTPDRGSPASGNSTSQRPMSRSTSPPPIVIKTEVYTSDNEDNEGRDSIVSLAPVPAPSPLRQPMSP